MAQGFCQNKVSLLSVNGLRLDYHLFQKPLENNDLWDVPVVAPEKTEDQEAVKITALVVLTAAINLLFLTGWAICLCLQIWPHSAG